MKKLFVFHCLLLFSLSISSQGICDTLRGYKVGANMNDSIPYFPLNLASPLGLSYSNYHMMYSDITQFNDDYIISSLARFNIATFSTPPPSRLTYDLDFPKLHYNNTFNNTYRDVKYKRLFKDRVFSHTVGTNGKDVLLSGSISDSSNLILPGCPGCNTKGMVMRTSIQGGPNNPIILTESGENPIHNGDVILKTVETTNFYYAAGYKILNGTLGVTPVRQGILYVIDKNVYNKGPGNVYQCANTSGNTATGVRLFRIQNIVADLIVEPDESTIYVCGAVDMLNGGRGYIGKLDLNANNALFNYYRADPWLPSPNNNNTTIFSCLQRSQTMTNNFYAAFRLAGNHAPFSRLGLVRFDDNLTLHFERSFDIDFGPSAVIATPPAPGWIDVFPTAIEVDNLENIYIGAYVKDFGCTPAVSNCLFQHFTLVYNESNPDIDPSPMRWIQNVNGFIDFGFSQLDNDPLARLGGAVNSLTTLNKMPRTLALNSANDTLHIAYLVEDVPGSGKNTVYHYKRPTSLYTPPNQFDNCAGTICSRQPFNTVADSTPFILDQQISYLNLNGSSLPNYLNGDMHHNVYEVFDCNILVDNTEGKWHEEYPVTCRQKVYDSSTGCNFWTDIRVHSGSDTICKSPVDTLSVAYRSPFGVNTFEWVNMNNPSAVLSTDMFLEINTHGLYRVICTRNLSDGTTCSDTFFKTIKQAQDAWVLSGLGSSICPGEQITIEGYPVLNSAPFYSYKWSTSETTQAIDIDNAQKYYVTVTFLNGCKDVDSIDIVWASPGITQTISNLNPNPINGINFTNTISVFNPTNQAHTGLIVTTILPAGYEVAGALPSGWSQTGQTLTFTGLSLSASSQPAILVLNLRAVNACQGEICTELTASPALACNTMPKICNTLNDGRILNPVLTVAPVSSKCPDVVATYTGTSSGANNPAKTHSWFTIVGGVPDPIGGTTASFQSAAEGSFRYQVSQAGCTQHVDYTMANHALPTYTLDIKPTCNLPLGSAATGSIEVQNIQPPLMNPNDFVWLTGAGGTATTNTSNPRQNLALGNYTFRITDATSGCKIEETVAIVNIPLSLSLDNVVSAQCSPAQIGRFDILYSPAINSTYSHFLGSILMTANATNPMGNVLGVSAPQGFNKVVVMNGVCAEEKTVYIPSVFGTITASHTIGCNDQNLLYAKVTGSSATSHRFKWYRLKDGIYTLIAGSDAPFESTSTYTGVIDGDLYVEVIQLVAAAEVCRELKSVVKSTIPVVAGLGVTKVNASQIPLSASQIINGGVYQISGLFNINVNNLTFNNVDFQLRNNTIPDPANLSQMITIFGELRIKSGINVTFTNCRFYNVCENELAKGIVVEHNATVKMTNSSITDMMRGMEFLQDANVELVGNRFGSNAIGIQISHSHGRLAPINAAIGSILGNTFQPLGVIKPNAKNIPYGNAAILPTAPGVFSNRGFAGIVSLATTISLASTPPTGYTLQLSNPTYHLAEVNTFSNLFYGIAALGGRVNVYHPIMSNIQQLLIEINNPFPFPPTIGYMNNFTYPAGMSPMEGTGILMYNTTPSAAPSSQLMVQGDITAENFNLGVFRCVDARDAQVTVDKTRMVGIYNGFYYQRSSTSNGNEQVQFTDNIISDKLQANGDMASALIIQDVAISNNSYTRYDIARNTISSIVSSNSGLQPVFLPGTGTPQSLVHIRSASQVVPTGAIAAAMSGLRLVRNNVISNKGVSSTAVKFTNVSRFSSTSNEVTLSDGLGLSFPGGVASSIFRAGFEYDNCNAITESANLAKSTALSSSVSTSATPTTSFPVGFNYRNTQASTFSCNQAHRGLMSSVLFEGNCTNSFLRNANLNANRYGIIIANNATISVHHFEGNKFYCGSHIVSGVENHIWRGTNSGTGVLFRVARLSSSFTSPCASVASGQCYSHNNQGFIYAPLSIPSTIMQASMSALDYPVESVQCPICIPLPKMAASAPVDNIRSKVSDCTLFPNPTSDDASVRLDHPLEVAMAVRVMDMTGRVLVDDILEAGATEYKLKSDILTAGIYQVVVLNGKDIYCMKRLVVEK